MVRIHIGQLEFDQHHKLFIAPLLTLPNMTGDDPFGFFAQPRISLHSIGASLHNVGQFGDDQIDRFQNGLPEFGDLLLDNRFESGRRCEKAGLKCNESSCHEMYVSIIYRTLTRIP
jgi:hypothetical protein